MNNKQRNFSLLLVFFAITLLSKNGLSQRSVFQKTGVSFSLYEKPAKYNNLLFPYYGAWFSKEMKEQSEDPIFANVKNNFSVSAYHSWTNLFNRSGFEFGLSLDFIFINNNYALSYIESSVYDYGVPSSEVSKTGYFELPKTRTTALTLGIPLYYVHKFQLNEHFTLFARIGPKIRMLLGGSEARSVGEYKQSTYTAYDIHYMTSYEEYSNGYGQIITRLMFDWQYSLSLDKQLGNGSSIGIDFSINTQFFSRSFIVSKIDNLIYENDQDDIDDFYSSDYFPPFYTDTEDNVVVRETTDLPSHYAQHKLNGLSIGVFYRFGNKSFSKTQLD